MDCLACKNKLCKLNSKDCNSNRDDIIPKYKEELNNRMYLNADKLVAGGKAGNLSRLEEIVELSVSNQYKQIAIAYCYSMENLALDVKKFLKENGIKTSSYRCTINGIKENQVCDTLGNNVNCNPIGQAEAINNSDVDFVIEMGLCHGHDILFHQYLKKPVSTFIVKDRVYNHNPANALESYKDTNTKFLESYLDNKMGMKPSSWLREQLNTQQNISIIDLRDVLAYEEGNILGSINIPLKELPSRYKELLFDRNKPIICYCNGSIQSAYAIMFLYSKGYKTVYNLSGGFSGWQKTL
ncbi:MAG: hypothetical protein A2Y40_08750 [Candidatus Margulisbacteria bacterium GWF2_35_9]|nr:MAG: hypothetical protein A2Y40_08750 [Candidatus Margulisbacteria bacterium GWF2_35_9]